MPCAGRFKGEREGNFGSCRQHITRHCVCRSPTTPGAPKRLLQFLQELAPSCGLSDAAAVVVSICRNR